MARNTQQGTFAKNNPHQVAKLASSLDAQNASGNTSQSSGVAKNIFDKFGQIFTRNLQEDSSVETKTDTYISEERENSTKMEPDSTEKIEVRKDNKFVDRKLMLAKAQEYFLKQMNDHFD